MKQTIPVITLLTDFGLKDEYVGAIKGVILSINSRVQLVDISHNLTRHDILQAALIIKGAFRYFPKGSIHVIVVDPGVGGKRKVICLKKEGHVFVAPDNGVLSLVTQDGKADEIYAVSTQAYFLKPVSNTFHGRDIIAPVAAHLSKGAALPSLGEKLTLDDINTLDIPVPFLSSDGRLLAGEIISIDHFGNLITNIDQKTFEIFTGKRKSGTVVIGLGSSTIQGVSESYDTVKVGDPLAIFGSRNLLEISVNQADASSYFRARVGLAVNVEVLTKKN
ncbi:MAG: SAM-dependent chlorinase/fluorinase [Deltaproteobacteria bacterium]|nr:SAM-dependent chlorinase/fluorinase [Deltaproteobacteria bacterium]